MFTRLPLIWIAMVTFCIACTGKTASSAVKEAFGSAENHYNKGEFESAIADLDRVLELDPDNGNAYFNRGMAYLQKGEVGRFNSLDSGNTSFFGSKSDVDHAIADFDMAIELIPDNSSAYKFRALAYSLAGNLDQAITDYDQAIALDPNDAEAYTRRGSVYVNKGDLDQAIIDYGRALELAPDYMDIYNGRSMAYWLKGDLDSAIADLDRVIELAPDYAQAYKNRAVACAEKGDLDQAIADFREFWRLSDDPGDRQFAEEQLALLGASP